MGIEYYISTVRRYVYILIATLVLFGAFGWYQFTKSPISYSGSVTFTAGDKNDSVPNQFNYDRYYTLQASGALADSISSWLNSPNIVEAIYNRAGVKVPGAKIVTLTNTFKTVKSTPYSAVVVGMYSGSSSDEVHKMLDAARSVVSDQLSSLQSSNTLPAGLSVSATNSTVVAQNNNPYTSIGILLFAGLILGLIVIFFVDALTKSN